MANILIVDNEKLFANSLKRSFEFEGHKVTAAYTESTTNEILKKNEFDLGSIWIPGS